MYDRSFGGVQPDGVVSFGQVYFGSRSPGENADFWGDLLPGRRAGDYPPFGPLVWGRVGEGG